MSKITGQILKDIADINAKKNYDVKYLKFIGEEPNSNVIQIQNNLKGALKIVKESKDYITCDTSLGNEKVIFHKPIEMTETARISSLLFKENRIYTNDKKGNILLCPGRMGDVLVTASPRNDMAIATKKYVDLMTRGLTLFNPVIVSTINPLPTYNYINDRNINMLVGHEGSINDVGIDNYRELTQGDRVLVTFEGVREVSHVGIYLVEAVGNDMFPWILKKTPEKIKKGMFILIEHGDDRGNTTWVNTNYDIKTGKCEFIKYSNEYQQTFKNVGDGLGIYKRKRDSEIELKSISSSSEILYIKETDDSIEFNINREKIIHTIESDSDIISVQNNHSENLATININENQIDISLLKNTPRGSIVGTKEKQFLENKDLNMESICFKEGTSELRFSMNEFNQYSSVTLTPPPNNDTIVGIKSKQTVINKTFIDSVTWFSDDFHNSKKMQFDLANISKDNTVRLIVPDETTTIVGTNAGQTLSNKYLDYNSVFFGTDRQSLQFNIGNFKKKNIIKIPDCSDEMVTLNASQILKNKVMMDDTISIQSAKNNRVNLMFNLDKLTKDVHANKTFRLVIPSSGPLINMVDTTSSQTLSNKTISLYENNFVGFDKNNLGMKNYVDLRNEYNGLKEPTKLDNKTKGFSVGSTWINNENQYMCANESPKWKKYVFNNDLLYANYTSEIRNLPDCRIFGVKKTPMTVKLIVSMFKIGRIITVKDETGKANTAPITVMAEKSGIDGKPRISINEPYGYVTLYCNGQSWHKI